VYCALAAVGSKLASEAVAMTAPRRVFLNMVVSFREMQYDHFGPSAAVRASDWGANPRRMSPARPM
jgi:hypothetical protein